MYPTRVEPQLLPGDIGFIMVHNKWIPKIIAWFMGSKWAHCFLVHEVSERWTYTSETNELAVILNCLEKSADDKNVSYEIWRMPGLPTEKRKEIANLALMHNLGENYGWLQLFSLGVRRILMRLGIKIPNFIRQGVVCNEHVMYGYTLADIPGFQAQDPESLDTEELYLKIKDLGFSRITQKLKG